MAEPICGEADWINDATALNHVVVLGEQHLRRVLTGYFEYYHGSRTHLSLAKDSPTSRRMQDVTEVT